MKAPTPSALVKMTHWYRARCSKAASRGAKSAGGTISRVGTSRNRPPAASSKSTSREACCRERVTTTVLPHRGRFSHHFRLFASSTTPPTTKIVGGLIPASRAR